MCAEIGKGIQRLPSIGLQFSDKSSEHIQSEYHDTRGKLYNIDTYFNGV
jgi:hypothetical protein